MLRQRARSDFQNHRGKFTWRVIVLLHRINDPLAGSEIDRAASGDRKGRGPALRGVLAFAFDGDFLLAEHVEFTLCVGLLVNLASFGRGSNWVENPAFSDAGLNVLSD